MDQIIPKARQESLIVVQLHDETLIYDTKLHQAMCLNPPAAAIWKHCDGQTTVAELIPLLKEESEPPIDEDIVMLALHQFNQHHLLDKPPACSGADVDAMRRRLMKVGVAAALLPLISVVTAPTAAQAATPGPTGPTGPTGATGPP